MNRLESPVDLFAALKGPLPCAMGVGACLMSAVVLTASAVAQGAHRLGTTRNDSRSYTNQRDDGAESPPTEHLSEEQVSATHITCDVYEI